VGRGGSTDRKKSQNDVIVCSSFCLIVNCDRNKKKKRNNQHSFDWLF
jgi:hypothetical protein